MASAALALSACAGQINLAETHRYKGVMAANAKNLYTAAVEYNAAAQLNPWDIELTIDQLSTLYAMTEAAPVSERQQMAEVAVLVARSNIERHPSDSYAYHLYAATLVSRAKVTGHYEPDLLIGTLQHAIDLAPTFLPLVGNAVTVATMLGREQPAWRALYKRIQPITGGA